MTRISSAEPTMHQRGFTLVELSFVMLIMGLMMLVALPNMARNLTPQRDFYDTFSLWTETIHERAGLRGEVFLLEFDFEEHKVRAVQAQELGSLGFGEQESQQDSGGNSGLGSDGEAAQVNLVEISDPYFPATLEWPPGYELDDVQLANREKIEDETFLLVFYPYGWVDPLTIHLLDDQRREHTGFINTVTGRIRWVEGYSERDYEELEEF